ncbi:MAG: TetR/AcrR family transcriptional regulator [Oscillospiraceae bacterium]|nr:TetR/AcrR family transcriptional regulator [Oscillospiraceae bacterium]
MSDCERHKIMAIDREKRDRIINAAMKEFNKGYKNASTDAIVKEAGISKGLLFHYFGSKDKLLDFIIEYAIEVVVKEYFELINFEQRDILERIWQTVLLKFDLSYKYPMMFDFLTTAYKENMNGVVLEMYGRVMSEFTPRFFSGIDESLFKDGIEPKMAMNVIYWTQVGYSHSQLEQIDSTDIIDFQKEYERYLSEIQSYFDLFRKIFYK